MKKTTLYMIGNSHIDPVWFWEWDEGMQEVKATFRAALERLEENPEITFTVTSTAFLEWLEAIAPPLWEKIKERVKEGRFLLTGGWYIEPDCLLPCTEALIRQGLYGQRYLQKTFGRICRTGSNVDSFGHTHMMPQLLRKSGMREYIFMRPRLDTPVFVWESPDGSQVTTVSLPSEYVTWSDETTRKAVKLAAKATEKAGLHGVPCCFGVGNHGGGPTKENIQTVYRLRNEFPEQELVFAGYHDFFDRLSAVEREKLPVRREPFEKVNPGCYSMDSELKRLNRLTEKRLMVAETMLAMEQGFLGKKSGNQKEMERLWKILLFNQFHDTLGGTTIKPARDEALMQLAQVCARSKQIWTLAMQNMVNAVDTTGEGFPLFLWNPSGEPYLGPVEIELNWYCKEDLTLIDSYGNEVPYQRVYTQAKVRNHDLGGRRAICFQTALPAAGFVLYRTLPKLPTRACDIRQKPEFPLLNNRGFQPEDTPTVLENEWLRATFGDDGYLASLYDKKGDYEALAGKATYPIWRDQRDDWGNGREPYEDTGEKMTFSRLVLVESGTIRKVVRAEYVYGGSCLKQTYTLYRDADYLEITHDLFWDREWSMLRLSYPLAGIMTETVSECAGGTLTRKIFAENDGEEGKGGDLAEYSMHRFVDIKTAVGSGLAIANDSKYVFTATSCRIQFPVARSAIYAQGSSPDWQNQAENYEYADKGMQHFTFLLKPHGKPLTMAERYRLARHADKPYLYLADCAHPGGGCREYQLLNVNLPGVRTISLKLAEDSDNLIVRLKETEGRESQGTITVKGCEYPVLIRKYEIMTLLIDSKNQTATTVDFLERSLAGDKS